MLTASIISHPAIFVWQHVAEGPRDAPCQLKSHLHQLCTTQLYKKSHLKTLAVVNDLWCRSRSAKIALFDRLQSYRFLLVQNYRSVVITAPSCIICEILPLFERTWLLVTMTNPSVSLPVQQLKLECGPMPNVMATLSNIGGALCSTPQSLADAYY